MACRLLLVFLVAGVLVGLGLGLGGASPMGGMGVNWGRLTSHPLLPSSVVDMPKANGIRKVKLFDADAWTVEALANTGTEVMVAIPNDRLWRLREYRNARRWVDSNVTAFVRSRGVDIRYVAVGNEPFLGSFIDVTLPALKKVQRALVAAGLGDMIKATVPLNANNPVPSAGNFRPDIRRLMVKIVRYLHSIGAPKLRGLAGVKWVEYPKERWCVADDDVATEGLAGSVDYACSLANCTALAYGSSCNHMDAHANESSYAFNMYFQTHEQDVRAKISHRSGGCLFPLQIVSTAAPPPPSPVFLGLFLLFLYVFLFWVNVVSVLCFLVLLVRSVVRFSFS